jgi:hypothetical protein
MSDQSETKPGMLSRIWASKATAVSSLVVIGLVLLSIVSLIVWNTVDAMNAEGTDTGAAATTVATAKATGSVAPVKDGCDVPAGDQSLRPTVPTDLKWAAANGTTWPVSATAGPTQHTKAGLGICFAKSPMGAALMVATMYGTMAGVDNLTATELYTADSPGKASLVAGAKSGPVDGGSVATTAGFLIKDFDATAGTATVSLMIPAATSSTGYFGLDVPLRWINNDWKVWAGLDNGKDIKYAEAVPGQFIAWKGSGNG